MLHASTQQLIRKLHELTEAGGLAWKEGEREASRLETEGYIVEVEATPATLRLLRGDGRELEKATAEDLGAVAWPGGDGTYATRVSEMAARAHRIARGAEDAIATILSSLSAPARKPAPQPAMPAPAAAPAATAQVPQPPVEAPFGDTPSFAKPSEPPAPAPKPPEPVPPPAPKKPDMLAQGISARSVQGVEQSSVNDMQRLAPAASQSAPAPAPTPSPAPRPPQPPTTGPGVYKPWN
jgi:hypothetical protein